MSHLNDLFYAHGALDERSTEGFIKIYHPLSTT